MDRKKSLPLLAFIFLLVIGLGYAAWQKTHLKPVTASVIDAKYVSLSGNYLFTIPDKYTVDETLIPGVTVAYPEASPPSTGQNLEELYSSGTVAIQPIVALKDNNVKAFKDYVSGPLASDIRKSTHAASDVRNAKQGDIPGFRVFALTDDGKRLRAIYAVDFTQPVMMVAKEEIDALKVIGSTIEDLNKTKYKTDIDQAANTTKTILSSAKSKDVSGILEQGTEDFKKALSKDQLAQTLQASGSYFDGTVAIVGGSYNGKDFVAQVVFGVNKNHDKYSVGTVQLSKEGRSWKLHAMQLPK